MSALWRHSEPPPGRRRRAVRIHLRPHRPRHRLVMAYLCYDSDMPKEKEKIPLRLRLLDFIVQIALRSLARAHGKVRRSNGTDSHLRKVFARR